MEWSIQLCIQILSLSHDIKICWCYCLPQWKVSIWSYRLSIILYFIFLLSNQAILCFFLRYLISNYSLLFLLSISNPGHHLVFICATFLVFNLRRISHQMKINLPKSLNFLNAYFSDFLLWHMSLLIWGDCYHSSCCSKSESHHPSIYWCVKSQTLLVIWEESVLRSKLNDCASYAINTRWWIFQKILVGEFFVANIVGKFFQFLFFGCNFFLCWK